MNLLNCLEDYTVDQRGDVGSWIRTASLHALGSIAKSFIDSLPTSPDILKNYLPRDLFESIIAAMLKQASERLDTVRYEAGLRICELVRTVVTLDKNGGGSEEWRNIAGLDVLREALVECVHPASLFTDNRMFTSHLTDAVIRNRKRKSIGRTEIYCIPRSCRFWL